MARPTRLIFLPAALATTAAAFFFWRWLGEPVALPDAPAGGLRCLSYTPFEPGQLGATTPGWVSDGRIADDLARLGRYTRCLRLYTPLGTTPRVIAAAEPLGFRVVLGAWIGSDLEQNERELRGALDLARRYPHTVEMLVAGNEVLLRREMSADKLAALIRDLKEQSEVPVAYADVAHFIEHAPAVAAAADVLLIHLLPYWDDPRPPPVADSVEQVIRVYEDFQAKFPGRKLWIGETGWPSKGRMRGPGWPGLVEEARFVRGFASRAATLGIDYNLIEAIDQPWKRRNEGTVGAYWGILDERREPKFALSGPVSAWPRWRESFAATAAIAAAFLAFGLRRGLAPAAWARVAAAGLALGFALVFQWDYATVTSQSVWGYAAALVAAGLSVAATARLAGAGSGRIAELVAAAAIPAAWIGLTLAFAPRHRDIPLAWFALPALAAAINWGQTAISRARKSQSDPNLLHPMQREGMMLAGVLIATGLLQLEPSNPESVAWLAVSALLALPWLRALWRRRQASFIS